MSKHFFVDCRRPACVSRCEKLLKVKMIYYRIRSGDCRVIYQVRKKEIIVLVLMIGHRNDKRLKSLIADN